MAGFFISIEGIEGAGKSTIARRLESWLHQRKYPVVRTREPGGTELGEQLRKLILDAGKPLCVEAELLLIEAARAQIMDEIVLPNLVMGKTVILDRHRDSTTAYQGYGRGVALDLIDRVNHFSCRGRTPNITILLDVDVKTGLQRAQKVPEKSEFIDRFETEAIEFMQRVREGFLKIAQQEPHRVMIITAQSEENVVWEEVKKIVISHLPS